MLFRSPEAVCGRVSVTAKVGECEFDLLDWTATANANSNSRGATVRFVLPNVENADRITLKLSSEKDTESTYEFLYKPQHVKAAGPRQLNV